MTCRRHGLAGEPEEQRPDGHRGPGEQSLAPVILFVREPPLEQLTHRAERGGRLELRAAGAEN
jgi:hypothetical protein